MSCSIHSWSVEKKTLRFDSLGFAPCWRGFIVYSRGNSNVQPWGENGGNQKEVCDLLLLWENVLEQGRLHRSHKQSTFEAEAICLSNMCTDIFLQAEFENAWNHMSAWKALSYWFLRFIYVILTFRASTAGSGTVSIN